MLLSNNAIVLYVADEYLWVIKEAKNNESTLPLNAKTVTNENWIEPDPVYNL